MRNKTLIYSGIILIITSLFYRETFGLNVFLFSLILVGSSLVDPSNSSLKSKLISFQWWMANLILMLNGFAVFYTHSLLSLILLIPSIFYYIVVNHSLYFSIISSTVNGIISVGLGILDAIKGAFTIFSKSETYSTRKIFVRILMITIPLIVGIIFLKLYQQADPTFYEWTKFINLDWISFQFIFFYLFLLVVLRGLFFVKPNKDLIEIDRHHSLPIDATYSDKIQHFFGIENEKRIAYSILILLNLMLLLYNLIDVHFVLTVLPNPSSNGATYSQLVHGGINALIFSIVLVILILVFLFRGQLNFESKPALKYLAISWLFLNSVMVITSFIKNYEYVAHWGLTYKRLGVFIYLLLALVGLVFCLFKINQYLSAYRLARKMGFTFLLSFTILGLVNWDKMIAKYNLTQLETSKIDFDYLASLGDDSTPFLLAYFQEHLKNEHDIENHDFWHRILNKTTDAIYNLKVRQATYSWLSFNYHDYTLEKSLSHFDIELLRQNLKAPSDRLVQSDRRQN